MKHLSLMAAAMLVCSSALAVPDATVIVIADNYASNTFITTRSAPFSGELKQVNIELPKAGTTGVVALVLVTNASLSVEQILYSNAAMTASTVVRPRFTTHDAAGGTNASLDTLFLENAILELRVKTTDISNKTVKATTIFNNWR